MGLMLFIGRIVHDAWRSMRVSWGTSLLASLTIGAQLLVLGVFTAAVRYVDVGVGALSHGFVVRAFAADAVDKTKEQNRLKKLGRLPHVAKVVWLDAEDALARFVAANPNSQALVAGVDLTLLDPFFEIHLLADGLDFATVGALAAQIESMPGILGTDFSAEEYGRLGEGVRLAKWALGGLAVFVAWLTAWIIAATLRLSWAARAQETAILLWLGADPALMRWPQILEGTAWGTLGALGALAALLSLDGVLALRFADAFWLWLGMPKVDLVSSFLCASLLGFGAALGCLGAWVAMRNPASGDAWAL